MKKAVIIFQKNRLLGKVKTRLAKSIGDAEALYWYEKMIDHTHAICSEVTASKFIFFSEYEEDKIPTDFHKKLQFGNDLGEKMLHAFETIKNENFDQILIIGTDCFELTSEKLEEAFEKLKTHDFVLGPAKDGGYYLLGLNEIQKDIFHNKDWSTNSVLSSTLQDLQKLNSSICLLETLNDIDNLQDLIAYQNSSDKIKLEE